MGVSLNGGTPKTPQVLIIFSRSEKPWLLGTTTLGNPHMFYLKKGLLWIVDFTQLFFFQ